MGRTTPVGNQEGVVKWGDNGKNWSDIREYQASYDFWGRQNCSPSRAPITHATPLLGLCEILDSAILCTVGFEHRSKTDFCAQVFLPDPCFAHSSFTKYLAEHAPTRK